jgi:hypothetical protein
MSGPAPGAAPEPAAETWTYGGIRAGKDGKRRHAWLDPDGEELLFASAGGRPAIGSLYSARVTRGDDGITLHGTPEYTGSHADQAVRQALWTAHALAQTRLETLRAERDAARRSALDEALAPLLELAAPLRTGAQRDALAAYVLRRIHEAWNPRRPPGGRQQ